ncbi:MAG: ATP-binding cassette domain-containing protein [Jatrophihabitantaceae bacterium]
MAQVCEVRDVSKTYRGHAALAGVSLSVSQGELLAIVGPSGSGKSTLLNMLGLLDSPDRGEIVLFGAPAPGVRTHAATLLLRTRLAYLFQNFALIDNETVANNLRVAQRFVTGSRAAKQAARRDALERVGMAGTEGARVFELSGGEQQRIAVARLSLKPCELILADEPTGSLDPANRDRILDALKMLQHAGKTIVIVTHDPQVVRCCDRSITLKGITGERERPVQHLGAQQV